MSVTRINVSRGRSGVLGVLSVIVSVFLCMSVNAGKRAIDLEHSSLTVHVFKSGLLSALGDNHVIRAPILWGSVEDSSPPRVEIAVDARRMTVLDPNLSQAKRGEVQERMLGPEVLDVSRFPEIRFRSTSVTSLGEGRWRVGGLLTLHGHSAPVSFEVAEAQGEFRGSATLPQKAFGIEPISIAAGTVKVKNEVRVDFEIATVPRAGP